MRKVHLELDGEEKVFAEKYLLKRIARLKGMQICHGAPAEDHYRIQSCDFVQLHYLQEHDSRFSRDGRAHVLRHADDCFPLKEEHDFVRATALAVRTIKKNTGGYLARNLNKRISIPISLVLSRTGIHPNYLTVVNMLVGIASAVLVFGAEFWQLKQPDFYIATVLGGLLFQLASVFDGVDGEVAKFTFKFSRIGSWLDTLGDNLTLLLFLIAVSYAYFVHYGWNGLPAIIALFAGLVVMIGAMVAFLRRFSYSGSLVTYDKEFLQVIPQKDLMVRLVMQFKYYTKKEFFALFFFLFTFTGRIYWLIPLIAGVLCLAGYCW